MEDKCFFQRKFECRQSSKSCQFVTIKFKHIKNIIRCSKLYEDGIHQELQSQLDRNDNLVLRAHQTCVNKYLHPREVRKATEHQQGDQPSTSTAPTPKRSRRSEVTPFNFLEQCLYCGEECKVDKDPKNPSRWRPSYVCRQVQRTGCNKDLRQEILGKFDERNDAWASSVRIRVSGAVSDLHAADARYHVDCRLSFMSPRSTRTAQSRPEEVDGALQSVIRDLQSDNTRVWNSVDLHKLYTGHGGNYQTRQKLINRLSEHFGPDLVVLSSPGIAAILAFRSGAAKALRIISDPEDDDTDASITKVQRQIAHEVETIKPDRNHYNTRLSYDGASGDASKTVLDLLARLSPRLDRTLPAILIGNIITSTLIDHPTPLQISLAVKLRESKELVKTMSDFGVTCTYDELLRFKRSAAAEAAKNTELTAISKAEDGLVQIVADNFDAEISSPNGKSSTHSLAVLMTQPENDMAQQEQVIPRLKKDEMSRPIDYELPVISYNGPNRPAMPSNCFKSVPPLKLLAQMVVSQQKANEKKFAFLQDIVAEDNCPEFNGYNTRMFREQGEALQPKTKTVYLPLIDMPPAHHDTIMTAMTKAQNLTEEAGQPFTVFTADQQLYKVVAEVQWAYPDLFPHFIPRLGGMHMLMSFVGAVGTLMGESGLAEILSSVFGGVGKMLIGKKFPMNMRAMRMLAEELLRDIVGHGHLKSHDDLMTTLEGLAERSRTAKMWIDVFIKPVFIMMSYVSAEREGDWPLHLQAVQLMLPYFFASNHVNYARYGLYYRRSMMSLPAEVREHFMSGAHVMRHIQGLWNGMWSDMFIETTFMRYGHGKSGIIGITLRPETLKTWALSLHVCGQLMEDLGALREDEQHSTAQTTHKEEAKAMIAKDQCDRKGLRQKLDSCINPLDPDQHPDGIVNVVNGMIAPQSVNVDRAIEIGTKQMEEFGKKLPDGFYDPIKMNVETMAVTKKSIKVGNNKVYDTNLIYSRVIGLQASSREVDIEEVMSHELSPVPTALFDETGEMRTSKSKSVLKKLTKVDISSRTKQVTDVRCTSTVIDGCALIWIPSWPASSPTKKPVVMDFVTKFKSQVEQRLKDSDVYLIFDRYEDFSTKCTTRSSREAAGSRVFQLSPTSPLPPQKLTLTVTQNKRQLIDIICTDLREDIDFHRRNTQVHKLVITGQCAVPTEISHGGVIIERRDMYTTHEEADNIIVQQAIRVAVDEQKSVVVLADDTDVYALLLYHYLKEGVQTSMVMESPIKERTVIDIRASVMKHRDIIPGILAGHALSGCDTVATCFGIGKGKMLKVLSSGVTIDMVGDEKADWPRVMEQATKFTASCYGQPKARSLSEARINAWRERIGRPGVKNTPSLASLPPTTEAFSENVKRAHLQTCVWKNALQSEPPNLEPTEYGYEKMESTKSLRPTTVGADVPLAPEHILRMIRCTCSSESPCKTLACGCNRAKLACTIFCACKASIICCNSQTSTVIDEDGD